MEPVMNSCEFCLGAKDGVPGNENVFHTASGPITVCDYCTILIQDIIKHEISLVTRSRD